VKENVTLTVHFMARPYIQMTSCYQSRVLFIIFVWLVLEWTLPFPLATSMPVNGLCSRRLAHEKILQLRCPRWLAGQTWVSWVAENRKDSLESPALEAPQHAQQVGLI